jgi:hypothetical protein
MIRRRPFACIYSCGRQAGSREHLFPAAAGGLRGDRRISCEPCNNQLAPLDSEMANAFASVNALLGVRNRKGYEVSMPATEKRLRRQLSLSSKGDDVRILSPEICEVKIENGETVLEISGDDQAIRRAREFAASNGIKIHEVRRPRLIVELSYEIRLSSLLLRRAIGRLALQYLATAAPEDARAEGVAALREFVRNGVEPTSAVLVWIDHDTNTYEAVPQSHRFGHRVAITFSKSEQRILGHVCLYGCFGYGIDLGPAAVIGERSYVWDIDPLAEREPTDQCEIRPPRPLRFERIRPITKLEGLHRITYLVDQIKQRKWFLEAPVLVREVNATRPLSLEASSRHISHILADQRQRLLALATEGIRFLEFWLDSPRARAVVEPKFRRLISARRRESRGVAPHTWKLLESLRGDLAIVIAKRLIARPMNAWDLCALLIGLEGQALAIRRLALMSATRASFVSVDTALHRIKHRNIEMLRAAEELRNRCRSSGHPSLEESQQAKP